MRPGRLDQLVYIPLPDKASRLDILKVFHFLPHSHVDQNLQLMNMVILAGMPTQVSHRERCFHRYDCGPYEQVQWGGFD